MDIAPYIADLLRQHDEVNVPSLGTFYKQRKSGFYNPEKKEFFPPSHGLLFKEAKDTTVLNSYISEQKNISANTSNYFIEKFVSQTKSELANAGEAVLESLGTLKRSKDGYIFIDVLNFDDEGEFFGLQPVKELEVGTKLPESMPVLQAVTADETLVAENNIEADEIVEEEEVRETKKVSSATKILLIAAALILTGIITYLVNPQLFESFRQKTSVPEKKLPAKEPVTEAIVSKTLEDSIAQADTIYQDLAKQGFEVEKPRDTIEVSTDAVAVQTEPAGITFEIIGAAFARRTDAETYVKQLKAKGIYAKIVENMPGSKLKISLGTFNDEASANQGLIRIKKELNKDAWIARVKPKKTNK